MELISALVLTVLVSAVGLQLPAIVRDRAASAPNTFLDIVRDARELAATRPNGVTVEISPQTIGGRTITRLVIVEGRPQTGTHQGTILRTIDLDDRLAFGARAETALGLFVSPNGAIAVSFGWSPWTTMNEEPGDCGSSLAVDAGSGYSTTLTCGEAIANHNG